MSSILDCTDWGLVRSCSRSRAVGSMRQDCASSCPLNPRSPEMAHVRGPSFDVYCGAHAVFAGSCQSLNRTDRRCRSGPLLEVATPPIGGAEAMNLLVSFGICPSASMHHLGNGNADQLPSATRANGAMAARQETSNQENTRSVQSRYACTLW